MGMGFSCRKNAIFPGTHKIGAAISGPRIAGKIFYGHDDFSENKESRPFFLGDHSIWSWLLVRFLPERPLIETKGRRKHVNFLQRNLFGPHPKPPILGPQKKVWISATKSLVYSTVCILGALQRRVDLQGVFVKIGDFLKFKGFLVEFLENRRSWENQKPPANRQKSGLFWASPFTMHLVLRL